MRIYLADLGHNQLTLSSDVYPLGVANLAAYVQAYLQNGGRPSVSIFREPQELKAALDRTPPDIFGLSSYSWNHELSLTFARYAKARSQKILTLMGGPNFPLTTAEQETFLRGMPEIDVAVRGPTYEGERAFLNIVRRFVHTGNSLEGLQEQSVPGNMWIDRRTGEFVRGMELERIRDLDEIPSPYLSGWMDPFFASGYFPMMQISRGCPFSCSFCNSAVESNNRIFRHSVDNVKADLFYIAQRVRPEINLCFADDNFGMYPWDEEVAEYLAHLQDRFGWPQYVRTTTGKNKYERIIRVMRKARGILPMTAAVQSLNPQVLVNIRRENIKLESYTEIQKEVRAQGMQAYGELILCLPGETKASFMKAIRDLLEAGVTRISAHQLMLLHGAPLSNPEERARWGLETKFRVVARNIGNYTGEPVIETEEMVVATPTFSFEDYLEARVFHLLLTIFYYEGNYEEAFELARQGGIKPYDLVVRLQSMLSEAPPRFRTVIEDFVRESQEELSESREECVAWARRNSEALLDGSVGGNLLSKYSMLGRFYVTEGGLRFLEAGIAGAFRDSGRDQDLGLLHSVMEYLGRVVLHTPFSESLERTPHWTTSYDVEGWRHDGYAKSLAAYRYQEPKTFVMVAASEQKTMLQSRISTFGESASGLGKFTRTMFAKDLRRTPVEVNPLPESTGGVRA